MCTPRASWLLIFTSDGTTRGQRVIRVVVGFPLFLVVVISLAAVVSLRHFSDIFIFFQTLTGLKYENIWKMFCMLGGVKEVLDLLKLFLRML